MPTSTPMLIISNTQANSPPQPFTINKRWNPRRRGACTMCKLKKIRCDGATPCVNCRRHNNECQYILSKKRQALDKSPEKSPESRSKLDEISKTTTSEPAEAPDDAHLSPGSTLSFANTNSLTNDSLETLYRQSLIADDQTALRTLGDEYTGNMLGLNTFSWPFSRTDADSQFDFDLSFTAENADSFAGANSTALTDLNTNPSFNRLSRTTEPAEPFGEVIRFLNPNDKVTTRNFSDPVRSVNFSLQAIFLSRYQGQMTMTSAKQNEIYRIFENISLVQSQLSSVNLDDKECPDSYAAWYWNDAALMESCKAACFKQPLGIANFMPQLCFDKYLKDARNTHQANPILIHLIDSVMAFGYNALVKSTQSFVDPEKKNKADYYSKMALNSRGSVLRAPNSLLKLQTILALTTISEHIDDAIHSELLARAVNCARALRLENRDLVHSKYANSEDRELASTSLWYLYSVEVPYSLRRGISPGLDGDWIDHAPPQVYSETDWFALQCLYATVISSAAKMLYNQSALRQSLAEREQKLEITYKLLEDWRSRLPASLKDIHKPNMRTILDNYHTRHTVLSMFRQYHEAIFIIYFPWTAPSGGRVSKDCRRRSLEVCVSSAQAVLATANQVACQDILDRKFLNLIAVSICMTFLDVASSSGTGKSMSYLSIGCGIFGRLNLENEVPLADVLELTLIAQQIKGRQLDL
ncbi:hypothetical protein B0O99DRAFT_628237 [Bisporella sp. PMI_857]|nr:hypothetical protein B0O99DRAFT_628237 [Bisporella sp. PMI_857]